MAPEPAAARERSQRPFVWLYAAIAGVFPVSLASGGHHGESVPPAAAVLAALAVIAVVPVARMLAGAPRERTVDVAFRVTLAGLSAGAAAIHFVVTPHHFDEYWLFGIFFVVSALAQLAWSVLVVVAPSRRILVLGALGNLAIVVLWIYTRTVGLPIGPDAGETEAVGAADLLASAFELALVAGSVLAVALHARRPIGARPFRYSVGLALLCVVALTAIGLGQGATAS